MIVTYFPLFSLVILMLVAFIYSKLPTKENINLLSSIIRKKELYDIANKKTIKAIAKLSNGRIIVLFFIIFILSYIVSLIPVVYIFHILFVLVSFYYVIRYLSRIVIFTEDEIIYVKSFYKKKIYAYDDIEYCYIKHADERISNSYLMSLKFKSGKSIFLDSIMNIKEIIKKTNDQLLWKKRKYTGMTTYQDVEVDS